MFAGAARALGAGTGLSVALARPVAAVPGVVPGRIYALRQGFVLVGDLRDPRLLAAHLLPHSLEAATAEALPPRFELSQRGLQSLDAGLLRFDRRRDARQVGLDTAPQVPGRHPVVDCGLVHGKHEAIRLRLCRGVGGDCDGHGPAQGRSGRQQLARRVQCVAVGDGDAGETGRIELGEAADLPRRPEDVGEVDGIGLGIGDAGLADPEYAPRGRARPA